MGYDKDNDLSKDKSDDQPKTAQELDAVDAAATAYKRAMALTPVTGPKTGT